MVDVEMGVREEGNTDKQLAWLNCVEYHTEKKGGGNGHASQARPSVRLTDHPVDRLSDYPVRSPDHPSDEPKSDRPSHSPTDRSTDLYTV